MKGFSSLLLPIHFDSPTLIRPRCTKIQKENQKGERAHIVGEGHLEPEAACSQPLHGTAHPFFNITHNQPHKFPSQFRMSPSEFGETVQNPQHRKCDERILNCDSNLCVRCAAGLVSSEGVGVLLVGCRYITYTACAGVLINAGPTAAAALFPVRQPPPNHPTTC